MAAVLPNGVECKDPFTGEVFVTLIIEEKRRNSTWLVIRTHLVGSVDEKP